MVPSTRAKKTGLTMRPPQTGATQGLILMCGPSMDYPGGMTEVIRAYSAAGVFEAWPLRYISTYAGRDFPAKLRPWLSAVCSVLIRLAQRRVALVHVHSAAYGSFWCKSVL